MCVEDTELWWIMGKHKIIALSISSSFFSELFFGDFQTFVILSTILFAIKSPDASAVFWITLFEAVLSASVAH